MAQTGNLDVLVIAANSLKDVETFLGRMDPYAVLELSGQKFKTKSKTDAGKNPTWNERFTFINVSPQYSTELTVKVFDKNVMFSDTLVGSGRLPLSNIYHVGTQEVRLQLTTPKDMSAGELQLLLTWKPMMAGARPAAQPAVVVLQQPQPVMVPAPGHGAHMPGAFNMHTGHAMPPAQHAAYAAVPAQHAAYAPAPAQHAAYAPAPAQHAAYAAAPAQRPQQPAGNLYPQVYQPPCV